MEFENTTDHTRARLDKGHRRRLPQGGIVVIKMTQILFDVGRLEQQREKNHHMESNEPV
jgi:hypothetical protein